MAKLDDYLSETKLKQLIDTPHYYMAYNVNSDYRKKALRNKKPFEGLLDVPYSDIAEFLKKYGDGGHWWRCDSHVTPLNSIAPVSICTWGAPLEVFDTYEEALGAYKDKATAGYQEQIDELDRKIKKLQRNIKSVYEMK